MILREMAIEGRFMVLRGAGGAWAAAVAIKSRPLILYGIIDARVALGNRFSETSL